jgi:hypothetical protein
MIGVIAAAVIGGLLYRARGTDWREYGLWWAGTNSLSRPLWCIPTGHYVAWLAGGSFWLAMAATAALWLGLLIRHAPHQDDGTFAGTSIGDALGMTGVGLQRGGLLALVLLQTDAPLALAVGGVVGFALAGPAYWLGWRIPFPRWDRFIEPGTLTVPEVMTGAAIWAALSISALLSGAA